MHRASPHDHGAIAAAADHIAVGGVVGFFFNGAYALLGDADRPDAADEIFRLKQRPRAQTLSLVTDPRFWGDFIDLDAPALARFPLDRVAELHVRLHALGIIYPADPLAAPTQLVQDATILNVWTRYDPLIALQEACRARGGRALLGASANLSGDPTYTTATRMIEVFGDRLTTIFAEDPAVSPERRQSVSLVDLTGAEPILVRRGNTTVDEVSRALSELDLGALVAHRDPA
ncbi:MAG: Sua5/YciO/YrdC/YwlC family protein [Actinomycetota bacterium]